MTMRSLKHVLMGAGLAALTVGVAGCGDVVRQGTGSAFLVIDTLQAAPGGSQSPTFATVLQSDVLTNGSVWEDPGRVTLRIVAKDVTAPLTTNNAITINRYRVVYRRADGRATQGVDVPYAFDGAFTVTVGDGDIVTAGFTIVRAQAKLEAPLITLVNSPVAFGGGLVISTLADVTFYGKDQTGHDVSVTGSISINFADWGDPQ